MMANINKAYRGVRAAVFGADGFIGRWVARSLCAAGADLILAVRDESAARPVFEQYSIVGKVVALDIRDRPAVFDFYQKMRPSITFNLAGYGVDRRERDEQMAFEINAQFPATLCQALSTVGRPAESGWRGQEIIHVGSALEYGPINGNLAEDARPQPTTLYGQSKLAGTQALAQCCQEHSRRGVIARLFTIYGPGEHPGRLLPSLLETARSQRPLPLTAGTQKRDFTYVGDVAEGLLRLGLVATTEPGEIINLATGRLTTVCSFIETAAEVLSILPSLLQFGKLTTREEEMEHDEVTIERLRYHLNWAPTTGIAAGVKETCQFLDQPKPRS